MQFRVFAHVMMMVLLAACGSANANDNPTPAQQAEVQVTTTPLPVVAQSTPLPTQEVPFSDLSTLTIWWPDSLAPADQPEVTALIGEQIEAFDQSEDSMIDVEFRRKRYQDVGGIIATLRSANSVAPGALPDITLLRRSEVLAAAEEGLIYPMEGLVASAVLGDLYDSSIELGQVNDEIYGLAYMLDVNTLVYHPDEANSDWMFDAVLERGQGWAFPARRANGLSNVVYAQYVDVANRSLNPASPNIDSDALLQVFEFYEAGVNAELFGDDVRDYTAISDYADDLMSGDINAGILNSTQYIALRADGRDLMLGSIPTQSGDPMGVLDGWMWVITTNNADQQAIAERFLNWMMETGRQSDFSNAVLMLPSQKSALQRFDDDLVDVNLIDSILENAVIPLPENGGGTLVRNVQRAFNDLMAGEVTAEEALTIALE